MASDGERLAAIDSRWWGVHTSHELNPDGSEGRIIYGSAHRHAGEDIGWLLGQVRELGAALASAEVLRDGANERARIVYDSLNVWRERALVAESALAAAEARSAREAARLTSALVLVCGHLTTVDTETNWLVKRGVIRDLVHEVLGVEAITQEMLLRALDDQRAARQPGGEGVKNPHSS